MKKLKPELIVKIALCLVFACYIVLISISSSIFEPTSIMYDIYDETIEKLISVKLLKSAYVIAIGYIVVQVSNLLVYISSKIKNSSAKTITLLVGNAAKYVAIIVALLAVLSAFGIDTTTLVTGAGILTLVIGLGCQTLVSDIVAGIFLLLEGDIKVGDIVVVNGWRGTVLQIGLRRTKIKDAVGNINVINNSGISNIINNTRDLSVTLVDMPIAYYESLERAEAILAKELPGMKKKIKSIIDGPFYKGVSSFADSSVNMRIVAFCKEEDKFQLERDLNRELFMIWDQYGVRVPYNTITVDFGEEGNEATEDDKQMAKKFIDEQKNFAKGVEEQEDDQ